MRYYVEIPLCGKAEFYVEADSPEEAIEKSFNLPWTADFKLSEGCEDAEFEVYDLELMEETGRGNVCYLTCNRAYAEPL